MTNKSDVFDNSILRVIQSGKCKFSQIMTEVNASERQVDRALQRLRKKKLIAFHTRNGWAPAAKAAIPSDHFQACGFADEAEFHRLVAHVDIGTQENMTAFKTWQNNDGTKDGLLKLPQRAA